MVMPFDTLKLARRLEAAGFAAQQAGDTAEAFAEVLSPLATKDDLAGLQTATRSDLAALAAATKADLQSAMRELEQRIVALEHRVDQLAADLRTELADKGTELLKWVIGIVGFQTVAILGGVAALIHLLK
jgi:hypothetical protein